MTQLNPVTGNYLPDSKLLNFIVSEKLSKSSCDKHEFSSYGNSPLSSTETLRNRSAEPNQAMTRISNHLKNQR